ncbi:hypothetical protein IFM89_030211 [Coptis chinensis]|uniref:Uncharacterized protein n=1 Tax=Coptis chinensis TaxID=261450 RepID=A0A835LPG9_9MAGN|nr:hypothetical protein IFM89_030211 [Coptis chinensis]
MPNVEIGGCKLCLCILGSHPLVPTAVDLGIAQTIAQLNCSNLKLKVKAARDRVFELQLNLSPIDTRLYNELKTARMLYSTTSLSAGFGGIIRDHKRVVLLAYTGSNHHNSVLFQELRAIELMKVLRHA